MSDPQRSWLKVIITGLVVGLALTGGISLLRKEVTKTSIDSFEACAAAGNPIMESYPEQCHANGQTFVNPTQSTEPPADLVQ